MFCSTLFSTNIALNITILLITPFMRRTILLDLCQNVLMFSLKQPNLDVRGVLRFTQIGYPIADEISFLDKPIKNPCRRHFDGKPE